MDMGSDFHKVHRNSGAELQNKVQRRRMLLVKENGLINLSGRGAMMTERFTVGERKVIYTKQRGCGSNGNTITG